MQPSLSLLQQYFSDTYNLVATSSHVLEIKFRHWLIMIQQWTGNITKNKLFELSDTFLKALQQFNYLLVTQT